MAHVQPIHSAGGISQRFLKTSSIIITTTVIEMMRIAITAATIPPMMAALLVEGSLVETIY